jgi:hypothetical protein
MRTMALLAVTAFLSACSTIHFSNGNVAAEDTSYSSWHHNAIFDLIEVSAPVDLSQSCPDGRWAMITTELSFVGGLASAITYSLWTPWSVAFSCAE